MQSEILHIMYILTVTSYNIQWKVLSLMQDDFFGILEYALDWVFNVLLLVVL